MAICLNRIIRGCLMATPLLLSTPLMAQQTYFYRNASTLNYRWHLPDSPQEQQFLVHLPNQSSLPPWQEWRPAQANAVIYQRLLKNAKEQFPDVNFRYHAGRGYLGESYVDFETHDPAQLNVIEQWLNQQQAAEQDGYLSEHYYKLINKDHLRPDHIRIAEVASTELQDVAETMKSVALASAATSAVLANATDEQKVIAGLLDQIQSIPYDTLSSAEGMRGTDFLMPSQVLRENRGDCDSKATLMLALLHALYPDLPLAMIYVPEHALIAVGIDAYPGSGQASVNLGGESYLLMEVVGPAEIPPGQLGSLSRQYLGGGQYQYDILPVRKQAESNFQQ